MKVFSGLLRKEWFLLRKGLLIMGLFVWAVFIFLPIAISRISDVKVDTFEITIILSFLWTFFGIIIPMLALFIMLQIDMKRSDIWLHSTASIFQLIGAKAVFAVIIGLSAMLIPPIVIILQGIFIANQKMPLTEQLLFAGIFAGIMFVLSISVMCSGLFLWIFNRLIKPFVKGFSIPLTVILFFIIGFFYIKFMTTDFYKNIFETGSIDISKHLNITYQSEIISLNMIDFSLYTGEFMLETFVAVCLFIISIILFDKKVRL